MSKAFRTWKDNVKLLRKEYEYYGIPKWRVGELESKKLTLRGYRQYKRMLQRDERLSKRHVLNICSRNKVEMIRYNRNHISMLTNTGVQVYE